MNDFTFKFKKLYYDKYGSDLSYDERRIIEENKLISIDCKVDYKYDYERPIINKYYMKLSITNISRYKLDINFDYELTFNDKAITYLKDFTPKKIIICNIENRNSWYKSYHNKGTINIKDLVMSDECQEFDLGYFIDDPDVHTNETDVFSLKITNINIKTITKDYGIIFFALPEKTNEERSFFEEEFNWEDDVKKLLENRKNKKDNY